jgi:DNA (cytosine-5)-methyltransferase 1
MPFPEVKNKAVPNLRSSTDSQVSFTCAEYFAGIGLVRLGLEQAGWNIIFANDWEQKKFEMYSDYFENAGRHYKVQDIFSVSPAEVPYTLLATASFPCIDLSLAGNLGGIDGKYSSAFWGFTKILDSQVNKPQIIMLENVSGWLKSNNGYDFRTTIKELNRLGYACDVIAIDAVYFVPQSRPRIFVIGIHESGMKNDISVFFERPPCLKTQSLEEAILSNKDLRWNFLDIPSLPKKAEISLDSMALPGSG